MMNNPKPISEFLVPGKRAHLVGIGGVSMCPLAEVLAGKGLLVQGSDMTESDSVKHLRSKGISVAIGHNAENLGDCDFVMYVRFWMRVSRSRAGTRISIRSAAASRA